MTGDPEILAPETSGPHEPDLLAVVGRAFPGRTVKTQGTRIEIDGPGGALIIHVTPLMSVFSFRGARLPVPADRDAAAKLFRELGDGTLVLVEEQPSPGLRRTHLVRVHDGRLSELHETMNDRHDGTVGNVEIVSFNAGARLASTDEKRFLKRASGGVMGRLKRRIVEAIFEKTVGKLTEAVQEVQARQQAEQPRADDGSRSLKS